MRKQKLRKMKTLVQGPLANKQWGLNLDFCFFFKNSRLSLHWAASWIGERIWTLISLCRLLPGWWWQCEGSSLSTLKGLSFWDKRTLGTGCAFTLAQVGWHQCPVSTEEAKWASRRRVQMSKSRCVQAVSLLCNVNGIISGSIRFMCGLGSQN